MIYIFLENILPGDIVVTFSKIFLLVAHCNHSPLLLTKKASCQLLAKVCAEVLDDCLED